MKKTILFSLFILLCLSANLSAQSKINGKSADKLPVKLYQVEDGKLTESTTVTPDKKGAFSFSVTVKAPGEFVVIAKDPKNPLPLYLKEKDVATIELSEDNLVLTQANSPENQLLYQWQDMSRDLHKEIIFHKKVKRDELIAYPQVIAQVEALQKKATELMQNSPLRTTHFGELLQAKINTDIAYLALYALEAPRKNRLTKDEPLPAIYTQIIEKNPFDNAKLMFLPRGSQMLSDFAMYDYFIGKKRSFKNLYTTPELYAEATMNNAEKAIEDYAQYEKFMKKQGDFAVTPLQKKRLAALAEKVSFSKPREAAIDFALPDAEEVIHKLSDYKGKVVVVDVWATWCAPCKKEMPYLKKIEEELHGQDVVFIAICVGAAVEKNIWKKMIKEEKPAGVQLFAGSWTKGFAIDYKIKGVPRFMVFDREGKIVSLNAPQPSTPGLKQLIEKELKR
ncbi:MAG: TlpA disulfide reductase family protein [Bacteroidia bacterium]|nr:TlpA disulfide reductase family protein [Bacteroidia bacterium]